METDNWTKRNLRGKIQSSISENELRTYAAGLTDACMQHLPFGPGVKVSIKYIMNTEFSADISLEGDHCCPFFESLRYIYSVIVGTYLCDGSQLSLSIYNCIIIV